MSNDAETKNDLENEIDFARERFKDCYVDDWAEEGNKALVPEYVELSFALARDMDAAYRARFNDPMPTPMFFPDGQTGILNLEWDPRHDGDAVISMMISPDTGQISYYGEVEGKEQLDDITIKNEKDREAAIAEIIEFMGNAREIKLAKGVPLVSIDDDRARDC